ncbi:hypothetical protein BC939DRAFT_463606 [Gamsiella multidivaricata]|uniref:uncharacterized protein n=1 Tax=Gamsiella multidivaricata TaxID=101098 RepID=UPI00221FC956|nr:uncharacterized protein BC939DRAFT_463606 [Gamsiella multidivaricata]KAI7818199.1 hypothetical protein BC939DRAFT_463606 [Gamsiella multidivaricata]
MLFELRINKSVCKYVTIIQETVIEIRVFFIIFATGILGFAVATLHLLRGCPYEGCEEPETAFSHNFLGALSDTYFFMGGRWDPVSDEFAAQEWAFHLLMAIFFFFTVVLMLNVLIALINVAFQKGDDGWRLVWTESRLRYIELAENMSYHIPGFRKTHNWFPKEIYFTATAKQVRAYREKYHARDRATEDLEMMEKWMRGPEDDDDYQDDDEEVDADVGGGETNMDTKQEGDRDKEDSAVTEKNEDEKNKNSADDDEADRGHTRHLDGVIEDLSEAEYRNTIEDSARRRRRVKAIPSSDNLTGVRGAESDTEEQDVSFSHQGQGDLAVRMLNVQVGDLKSQVGELQMQLMAQQEQAQRQFEELKNLLTQRAGN